MPLARQRWHAWGIKLLGLLSVTLGCIDCRIRSSDPYWIETHGTALGHRVEGWAEGAVLLGGDQRLWAYPGSWANPWVAKAQTKPLRALAASNDTAFALLSDGQISRFTGGWNGVEGSAGWGASEIGVTDDNHLLVITSGKLSVLDQGALQPLACDAVNAASVAGLHGDSAFLLDTAGALYLHAEGRCDRVPAPVPLQRIAARSSRLLAVARDGSVWRRRNGQWSRLADPFKYRNGQVAQRMQADDVGVSDYSTWLTDTEGSVFILSDES